MWWKYVYMWLGYIIMCAIHIHDLMCVIFCLHHKYTIEPYGNIKKNIPTILFKFIFGILISHYLVCDACV
jgi:hypothetical protein